MRKVLQIGVLMPSELTNGKGRLHSEKRNTMSARDGKKKKSTRSKRGVHARPSFASGKKGGEKRLILERGKEKQMLSSRSERGRREARVRLTERFQRRKKNALALEKSNHPSFQARSKDRERRSS